MPQTLVATQVSRRFAFQSRAGGEVELNVVLAASPPANDDIKQLIFVCHGRGEYQGEDGALCTRPYL